MYRKKLIDHGAVFFFLVALTGIFLIYRPGLSGIFLFDDFTNLDKLAEIRTGLGGVLDYAFSTSRPLAFLSFLIDDNAWPSNPRAFLHTNLLFHILTGTVLIWLFLLSARVLGLAERKAQWVAVLGGVFWLVHPLMVSTTLYVVQRMTILGTLFVFIALLSYVHGRTQLSKGKSRGFYWLIVAVPGFALLGLASKQIGALVPVFLLLFEHVLFRGKAIGGRAFMYWRIAYIYVPIALMIAAIFIFYPDWSWIYQVRDFTLTERLLTQLRALSIYIGLLVIPRTSTTGLHYENFPISHSLLDPLTTLPSLVFLFALISLGFYLRKRNPVASMAIFFFFCGHLIESTFLGLELYFEHRNYLPSAFLFFGLAILVLRAYEYRRPVGMAAAALVLIVLGGVTAARVNLWGNPVTLLAMWVENNPTSERSYVAFSNIASMIHRNDLVDEYLDRGIKRVPAATYLLLGRLQHECRQNIVDPEHVSDTMDNLRTTEAAARTYVYMNLEKVVMAYARVRCDGMDFETLRDLVEAALDNPQLQRFLVRVQEMSHLYGVIELLDDNPAEAAKHFEKAFRLAPYQGIAMQQVALLASHEHYGIAMNYMRMLAKFNQTEVRFISDEKAFNDMEQRLHSAMATSGETVLEDEAERADP